MTTHDAETRRRIVICQTCLTDWSPDGVLICPDCGEEMCPNCTDVCPHEGNTIFDDGPPVGMGSDGRVHSDPYCAAIAPFGSAEARWGEICDLCAKRRGE